MTTTSRRRPSPDDQERGSQAVHRVLRILRCWTEDDTRQPDRRSRSARADAADRAPHDQALQRESLFVQDSCRPVRASPTVMDLARALLQRADQDDWRDGDSASRASARSRARPSGARALGDTAAVRGGAGQPAAMRTATGIGNHPAPRGASGKILGRLVRGALEIVEARAAGIPPDEREKSLAELARSARSATP